MHLNLRLPDFSHLCKIQGAERIELGYYRHFLSIYICVTILYYSLEFETNLPDVTGIYYCYFLFPPLYST